MNKSQPAIPPSKVASGKWRPEWMVIVATLLVWAHTITFEFVWDDRQFIQELQAIRSFKHVPEMFWRKEAQASLNDFNVFRPLRTMHYALLFALGGGEPPKPWLFHAANVLWHGAASLLLLGVARRLYSHLQPASDSQSADRFALFVATAFAVHPVVSEVACWAKSLDDEMAAVFTLAAMRSILLWLEDRSTLGRSMLWFLLAVYSKVSAVPFAMVVPMLLLLKGDRDWLAIARKSAGFLAIAFVFMVHRHFVIGQSSQTAPISGTYGQTLIDMLPVTTDYLRLMLGVPPFHIDYSFMKGGNAIASVPVIAGAVLLVALLVAAVRGMKSSGWKLAGFGLLWCGLFMLPVSNLLPMMQYMAERFLYLPLMGALLALGVVLTRFIQPRWQSWALSAVVLLWAGTAWNRSWIWKDRLTLFMQTHIEGPTTERVRNNAVAAVFALPQLTAVFDVADSKDGRLVMRAGSSREQKELALKTLEQIEPMFADDFNLLNGLGVLRAVTGRTADAVKTFEKAATLRPKQSDIWANLGQAQVELKQYDRAEESLAKATSLNAGNISAWQSLLRLHWEQEHFTKAVKVLDELRKLEPGNKEHEQWQQRAKDLLKQRSR